MSWRPVVAAFFLVFLGCVRVDLFRAGRSEKRGDYEIALQTYLRAAERDPHSSLTPEALYRAGRLASRVLLDYALAKDVYQRIIDKYGDKDGWGPKAERAIFNTPNYFPMVEEGQWEEGDSDTGGRNARATYVCKPLEGESTAAEFVQSYYAGERFVKELSSIIVYRKTQLELREHLSSGKGVSVILKYPLEKGRQWTTRRGGKTVIYVIESASETVRTRAGLFQNCLKVQERQEGNTGSWKVDYYAPGVGKVLTSLATSSSEKRNTELISYNLASGREIGE